jgi:hypothetical protein
MKKVKNWIKDKKELCCKTCEQGQMLLFVLVVILLLFIILFAIIVNVQVDIKETQVEREYERGYSIAEEELFRIASDGFDAWEDPGAGVTDYSGLLCPSTGCGDASGMDGPYKCSQKCNLGDDQVACVVVKRCTRYDISEMTINQDETLEVDLGGFTGAIDVDWDGASAISFMVVYKQGGEYLNVRRAICREGNDGCYTGFENYSFPVNIGSDLGVPGNSTVLARIRAIGNDATGVSVSGDGLPPQMEEVRVQGFSAGLGGVEADLPGPEVYTLEMINKRLPGLFDYVLFVADGGVTK